MTRVLCLHDQRAMEQRPRIAHRRDHTTVSFWCTRTARNHMPPGLHPHPLIFTAFHHHIFSSLHPLIFTSSHLHIRSYSRLLIFTSSHLHICSSFTPSHLHIFSSSYLPILTSANLHTFPSSHLLIFTSAHLHICSSSHLLTFSLTPSFYLSLLRPRVVPAASHETSTLSHEMRVDRQKLR